MFVPLNSHFQSLSYLQVVLPPGNIQLQVRIRDQSLGITLSSLIMVAVSYNSTEAQINSVLFFAQQSVQSGDLSSWSQYVIAITMSGNYNTDLQFELLQMVESIDTGDRDALITRLCVIEAICFDSAQISGIVGIYCITIMEELLEALSIISFISQEESSGVLSAITSVISSTQLNQDWNTTYVALLSLEVPRILNALALCHLLTLVPGQDALIIYGIGFELQIQKFLALIDVEFISSSQLNGGYTSFSIESAGSVSVRPNPTSLSAVMSVQEINLFGGNASSPIVSLSLFQISSENIMQPLEYHSGAVSIQIPTFAGVDTSQYDCGFWDESLLIWSTEGCETSQLDDSLICSCTHLTSFAATLMDDSVNGYSQTQSSHPEVFTWANILGHPIPIVSLGSFTVLFMLLSVVAYRRDCFLDREGLLLSFNAMSSGSMKFSAANGQREKNMSWLLQQLPLTSILQRHAADIVSSVDRVWIIYTSLLSSICCSAYLLGDKADPDEHYRHLFIAVFSAIVNALVWKIVLIMFPTGLSRFHVFFIKLAERSCREQGLLQQKLALSLEYVTKVWLGTQHRLSLFRRLLVQSLLNEDMREASLIPDFHRSSYAHLAYFGFPLVSRDLTLRVCSNSWNSRSNIIQPDKIGSYLFILIWIFVCWCGMIYQ